jgi:hypothetical protein
MDKPAPIPSRMVPDGGVPAWLFWLFAGVATVVIFGALFAAPVFIARQLGPTPAPAPLLYRCWCSE